MLSLQVILVQKMTEEMHKCVISSTSYQLEEIINILAKTLGFVSIKGQYFF